MHWERGRQKSGYDKFVIFFGLFGLLIDAYILKFPVGSKIPIHRDILGSGRKHYRLNIIIKKAKKGGKFICDKTIFESSRINLFRSDLYFHLVTEVEEGTRYVLSFGWAIKNA